MFNLDAIKSYEEKEENLGVFKVKTIKRIRKHIFPYSIITEIQPIMKIHERDGCYEIELISEGKRLEVKTDMLYLHDFANPFSRTI